MSAVEGVYGGQQPAGIHNRLLARSGIGGGHSSEDAGPFLRVIRGRSSEGPLSKVCFRKMRGAPLEREFHEGFVGWFR